MTVPPPDGSRDRRIEDPSNLWLIHPASRLLLPWTLARGISANAVSVAGLVLGAAAALAYARFEAWPLAVLGLVLSIGWLVADGLDGMVARATGTASPLGRMLDGLCDHGVFALIYVVLAIEVGTVGGWVLAFAAGAAHAVQSSLYEGERSRFHRRIKGVALVATTAPASDSPLVRLYDWFAGSPDRLARAFEHRLAASPEPLVLGARYGAAAVPPMRLLSLETANVRVGAIFIACLIGDPRIFWWFEIVPLTLIAVAGLAWHRRVERSLLTSTSPAPADAPARYLVKE
ncbi:CDP-alcohol phosphatidyltransferase family protein [Sphingomonas mollis]|uniref:CDP-alcohol phosphatidyltransferase family protein n=1 Tax=Sphingomonas mollis TaxID=2795726 RepID=A0ABS0XRY4_9SPHN|nr:CDP-alcohol phosphatidyltransferase family protein [Sphingomonas sp. BT553]MBJ6122804.1 CDP-alcohol phosphatidyltransferase family protein [Sphingomonas sp. BT553]